MKEEYRKLVIDLVNECQNERLLKQIFTIMIRMKRKAGD